MLKFASECKLSLRSERWATKRSLGKTFGNCLKRVLQNSQGATDDVKETQSKIFNRPRVLLHRPKLWVKLSLLL